MKNKRIFETHCATSCRHKPEATLKETNQKTFCTKSSIIVVGCIKVVEV